MTLVTRAAATVRRVSSSHRRSSVCGSTNTARVQKLLNEFFESVRISQIMLGAPEAIPVRVIQPADSGSTVVLLGAGVSSYRFAPVDFGWCVTALIYPSSKTHFCGRVCRSTF